MKKLLIWIRTALGLTTTTSVSAQLAKTAFESVLYESRKTGELMPVWERFVNTQFFVIVIRNDSFARTQDFRFSVFNNPIDQKSYVLASEHLERIENAQSGEAIRISGAEIVQMIQSELGIVVSGLDVGGFVIPKEQVQWLRESIQLNR